MSVRLGVGTSPWIVSDELWDHRDPVGVPAAGPRLRLGHDVLASPAGLERSRCLANFAKDWNQDEFSVARE